MSLEQARVAQRIRALQGRRRRARAEARAFGARLVALGAERVWLFGSALDARRFTRSGDVDLTVEGLPRERFLEAYRERIDSVVPVDLTDLAEARAEIAERIRREGRVVAARVRGRDPWRPRPRCPKGGFWKACAAT